jgi:hypothetical protein
VFVFVVFFPDAMYLLDLIIDVSLFSFAQLISGFPFSSGIILTLNRVHNSFYAISTLMYLLLVQVRYRVIKNIVPYRDLWVFFFKLLFRIIYSFA